MARIVAIDYCPRPQQRQIHDRTTRFATAVTHRRLGKTTAVVNDLIRAAIQCTQAAPRFAYIAPLYKQAKAIAWDFLLHYSDAIPGRSVHETELRIDLPGDRRIRLYGGDNPDALRGIYLDGVALDEYAQMHPRLWTEIIRPTLTDRKGWALFAGTPMGKNQLYELRQSTAHDPDWSHFLFRASETGIIAPEELDSLRRQMSPEEYAQEFECSFDAAIKGAYYARTLNDLAEQITDVPWEPAFPVSTWWDLGVRDATAIWFTQVAAGQIRVIDYYEASGEGMQHYADVLRQRRYQYDEHNAPHDIEVRELGSGRSRREVALNFGIDFRVVPNVAIMDGINAVRTILPRCWFDATRCATGIEALRQYRADYDEKRGVQRSQPLHDWTSHAADAFRYFAVGFRDAVRVQPLYTSTARSGAGSWMGT